MAVYAYLRVSTPKQKFGRQINNIRKGYPMNIPDENIIREVFTGTMQQRPAWIDLRKKLKTGDTIVFDEVSRMSRNAEEGLQDYMELYEQGINLIFIKDAHVNTDRYRESVEAANTQNINRVNAATGDKMIDELLSFMLQWVNDYMRAQVSRDIEQAFQRAEDEIAHLSERTKAGMEAHKAAESIRNARKGKRFETVRSLTAKIAILDKAGAFAGSNTDRDTARIAGVSDRTYFRYKDELLQQLADHTVDDIRQELSKKLRDKRARIKKKEQ